MEDQESLESSTVVSQLPDPLKNKIHNLLSNGVVTPGVVVGGVLLAVDQLLGMVKLTVSSDPGLVNDGGLEVNKDRSGDMLAGASLGEEGLEGIISEGLVRGHATIGLDAVLKAVQLPTSISNLDSSLANVDGDTFTLEKKIVINILFRFVTEKIFSYHDERLSSTTRTVKGIRTAQAQSYD